MGSPLESDTPAGAYRELRQNSPYSSLCGRTDLAPLRVADLSLPSRGNVVLGLKVLPRPGGGAGVARFIHEAVRNTGAAREGIREASLGSPYGDPALKS